MTLDQLENFTSDLKKAQKTTLLIDTQPHHDKDACLNAAKSIYDDGLPQGKTNLIYINALSEEYLGKFVLLDALLKELGQDLELFNKIQSGVMAAQGLLSGGYSIAGLLSGGLPSGLDSLLDNPLDYFAEKLSDLMTDKTYEILTNALVKQGENVSSSNSENHLNLSSKAKYSFIDKTLQKFGSELTLGEIFNLTESLLIDCSFAEDESKNSTVFCGKLLVIENPAGLDTISLALLNHLLAVCKDQQNLPFSLSFLYLRTKPDPKEGEVAEMLTNQRTFALRYGMYETPDADYPNRLITPDLFVGRQQELATLQNEAIAFYESEVPQQNYYHVVLGEPGMGKTRLVEKHLSLFRKYLVEQDKANKKENKKEKALVKCEAFTLKLKIYCDNQLSADSGLSSLISSLEKEIDRMALLYEQHETFFGRQFNKIKNQLLNTPEELIPLYKDFKKVKQALHNWRKGTAESIQQKSEQSQRLISKDRGNQKEDEFEHLDQIISLLLDVVQKLKVPKRLELFIDDLQWIDEVSAEYILRLLNRSDIQVRTLVTARGSDSESAIKIWGTQADSNQYRLALIQKLGYQGQNQWDVKHTIRVKPLDSQQVTQLIEMALATPRPELSNTLAEEVSAFLSPEGSDSLSTLFTVETLNLLSDSKLYENEANIKPVFEFEEGKAVFDDRTPVELKHDLQLIFKELAKKYQASFDQELGGFNLSSYAVMEERLRLIEQHLGKRYAHLLIFSHLSRSPFEPKLIENFINALAEAEELDASFRDEMVQACGLIENNELETLEEVYLLLDELEGPRRHLIYGYRHQLVEIFLGAAFKRMTYNLLPDSTDEEASQLEYSVRQVFHRVISNYLENHELTQKHESSLAQKETSRLLTLFDAQMLNLGHLFRMDCDTWAEAYTAGLNNLAFAYNTINRQQKSITLFEEALQLLKSLYQVNPEPWARGYIRSLNNLASAYRIVNHQEKAIFLLEEASQLLKSLYQASPERWAEDYFRGLNNLALTYQEVNRQKEAFFLLEEALQLLKPLFKSNPERWAEEYVRGLNNLALTYQEFNYHQEAIILLEEALQLLKPLHRVSPERWAEDYTRVLKSFASAYQVVNRYQEAITLYEEAFQLLKSLYQANPERWAADYTSILVNLASAYKAVDRHQEAIFLLEEALQLLKPLFKSNPERWSADAIVGIINLALTYHEVNRYQEALALYEEALQLLKPLYQANPERWTADYTRGLNNLASAYRAVGRHQEASILFEEALQLLKSLYQANSEYWSADTIIGLNNLASVYEAANRQEEAIALFEEALQLLKPLYRASPERWAADYTRGLNNLASAYRAVGRHQGAIILFEEALQLLKSLYQANSEYWSADTIIGLNNLASVYEAANRQEEAIVLFEEALQLLKPLYRANPDRWSGDTIIGLNNLASAYRSVNRLQEAITLYEEALQLLKSLYQANPERWVKGYIMWLNNLALTYQIVNRCLDAITLLEEALKLIKPLYQAKPESWMQHYTNSLSNLAIAYDKTNRTEEAISLSEEISKIRK